MVHNFCYFQCLCLVSGSMTCLLVTMGCWYLLLLLCKVQCVSWALVKFLLQMWWPCIWSIDVHNWEFILVDFPLTSMKCPSLSFLITFGWKLILFNIRMITPSCVLGPFLGKLSSSLLLWGSVCLCHWGTFLVCSKMLGPAYVSSLLVLFWGMQFIDVKR